MRLPATILAAVPGTVWIVVLDDGGVLLDDVCTCAGARHRTAQEHVDHEHHEEQHSQRHAQPQ